MAASVEHMDIVISQILESSADPLYRSIEVHKDLDVELDLGNLLACDPNPLEITRLRSKRSEYLAELARDNVQLLVNKLFQLPSERVEDAVVVKLPSTTTRLPREKPVPKPKENTKWEKFAALKGIKNKKKGRMVYDEQSKEYKPRWGYKRANDPTKDWLIPVPDTANPYEDQFEKRIKAKKESVAKNELQRLRNLARNMKGKVPGIGLTPTDNPDKNHLSRAVVAARTSNASMGRFTETLSQEKGKPLGNTGKKRKFEPNVDKSGDEKRRALDILSRISSAQPIVDKDKAAAQIHVSMSSNRGESSGKRSGKGHPGKGGRSGATGHTGGKGHPGAKGKHGPGGGGKSGGRDNSFRKAGGGKPGRPQFRGNNKSPGGKKTK